MIMKRLIGIVAVALSLVAVPDLLKAQDVQLTAGATIEITLTSPSVTYTLSSTTGINTLAVSDSTLTLTLDAGDTITVTQNNGYVIDNNLGVGTSCIGAITRATFTASVIITSGATAQGCQTGGSGSPISDASIRINNGASQTSSRNVTLSLQAGNAKQMILSHLVNFADAQWEPYAEAKAWTLTDGLGEKRVYVNYLSTGGEQSQPMSAVITLTEGVTAAPAPDGSVPSSQPQATQTPVLQQTGVPSEGALVKLLNDPRVYLISQGLKRWIQDEQAFTQQGYSWSNIVVVSDTALQQYWDGPRIESAVAAAAYKFTRYLAPGSVGTEVSALQKILKALGFFPQQVKETGYYGTTTRNAVIAFQKARGITPLGVVGPQTRAALNR